MICAATLCLFGLMAVDGDTFAATAPWGRQSFRLFGVDAPERFAVGGIAATNGMRALIDGTVLACDLKGHPSFNRLVVGCTLPDGRDLACEMIRSGLAVENVAYSKGAYAGCAE